MRYNIEKHQSLEAMTIDKESIESIERSMRIISNRVRLYGREVLKEYNLSTLQFIALQIANDKEGITIGDLSKRLGLAHSTTTDIVDKLERSGFVRREKYEKDKRIVLVLVLERADDVIGQVIEKRIEYMKEVTEHLTNDESKQLKEILNSVKVKMDELSEY
ncbi:DNA-binding transcriptional regulator, MarR family [Aliicoccus persicus]|uniref:DNA-binding transcriptional regulator, MarR family n=2 Tax=Aliicoccus persicus TaxID=930138 RepID=A0A662Z0U8_9STAP|nr:DNA-binding transcriptional regulator, MarR family [Aliicoccus persicus]